ncbi:hypothetical protein Tco_0089606 [Tanacetum coccineum]
MLHILHVYQLTYGGLQGFRQDQERRACMKNEELEVCGNTKINCDSAELTGCQMQSKIKLGAIDQGVTSVQFTTEEQGGEGNGSGSKDRNWRKSVKELTTASEI